jgi:hypothetical protein
MGNTLPSPRKDNTMSNHAQSYGTHFATKSGPSRAEVMGYTLAILLVIAALVTVTLVPTLYKYATDNRPVAGTKACELVYKDAWVDVAQGRRSYVSRADLCKPASLAEFAGQ